MTHRYVVRRGFNWGGHAFTPGAPVPGCIVDERPIQTMIAHGHIVPRQHRYPRYVATESLTVNGKQITPGTRLSPRQVPRRNLEALVELGKVEKQPPEVYYCMCGRKFDTPQALGGHLGKCPIWQEFKHRNEVN